MFQHPRPKKTSAIIWARSRINSLLELKKTLKSSPKAKKKKKNKMALYGEKKEKEKKEKKKKFFFRDLDSDGGPLKLKCLPMAKTGRLIPCRKAQIDPIHM
jgi:hypothetical protein